MRILFISGSLNQGGAEYQILKLAKLFQDKNHEIEVFALTDYSFYKYFIEKNEIKYSHLFNHQSKLKRIWLTSRKIKDFEPDVIIAYLKVVSKVTVIAKFLSGVKSKVIVGERTSDIQPLKDKLHFNLMRLANALTVNSISKKKYLQENFQKIKNKTHFFPNILNVSQFPIISKNYDSTILNLGFVGRISREKNITQMIHAVSILRKKNISIYFSIYGDTRNPGYLETVKNLIIELNLEDVVFLMGKTSEVIKVFEQIDILILISNYEGFSNVISEALCSGLPIITSDIPENKYLVEDGENGFVVNHKDPESIAEGIENYINLTQSEKRQISMKNRNKAKTLFDQDLLYKRYIDLINSL